MKLEKGQIIKPGRLGEHYFEAGNYFYVGRSRRGLRARIERHLRKDKKNFWHIDYFLEKARIHEVLIRPGAFYECQLAAGLRRLLLDSSIAVPGFGASDCGCPGHLIYLKESPDGDSLSFLLKTRLGLQNFIRTRLFNKTP